MGSANQRRERLAELPEIVRENGGKIKFGDLYNKLSFKWSVTKIKLWDYCEALKGAGALKYDRSGELNEVVIELVPDWKP
jgi:hypothetical protein